ncbi:MAG TPA: GtrA family protein [Thermopolyspora sp.]
MRALFTQLVRFGLVGAVGLVIDVGVFNLLRLTVFEPSVVNEGPVYAKVISTALAIIANWIGNRYWTFGRERRPQMVREGLDFAAVSLGGMVIGLGCLWVSHYLLGYTSLLADNISTNVVGLALGTAFRFWLYRVWVFSPKRPHLLPAYPETAHPEPVFAESDVATLSERPTLGSRPAPLRTPPADGPQWG